MMKKRKSIKLLAVVGSQRGYGNSFLLTNEVLKSFREIEYEMVQLADKELKHCNVCGKCVTMECPLQDDFNELLEKMKEADGIIFAYPKYLFGAPTKLLCFLERLDVIHHFRRHVESDYIEELRVKETLPPPLEGKPVCLFCCNRPGGKSRRLLSYRWQ